ncbi:MAG: uridine kinase [Lactobacillaceae bacterium]|jgi:uridine kinase|nr:uridine kinase [Lactobacillaceae bacterium]
MSNQSSVIIGIAGGSGSGKTTISNQLFQDLIGESVTIIPQDAYYKDQSDMPMEKRIKANYDHPDSFETDLLISDLLTLKNGGSINLPVYDYNQHTRSKEVIPTKSAQVIIVEGVLLFVDESLRNILDIKVYVDTDDDIRFIRRLKRDVSQRGRTVDGVISQYLDTVKPMFHQFVEPTKRYANIIIPEGITNKVGVEMLKTKIESFLK